MTPYHFYLSSTFFIYFQLLVTTTAKNNRSTTASNNKFTANNKVWAPKREEFGNKWPIPFEQNAETLPAIEVRLDPPSDLIVYHSIYFSHFLKWLLQLHFWKDPGCAWKRVFWENWKMNLTFNLTVHKVWSTQLLMRSVWIVRFCEYILFL